MMANIFFFTLYNAFPWVNLYAQDVEEVMHQNILILPWLTMFDVQIKEVKIQWNATCPHNSVIEEWWEIAVQLIKLYTFADGSYVNIYITLQG